MAQFLTPLRGEWLDDQRYQLTEDLVYQSDVAKQTFTIPAGFVTDFASVPRLPVIYLLFGGRAHHESVPHDFLYQTHKTGKVMADRVFLEAMDCRGKGIPVRWGMFTGVFAFGWLSYWTGPKRYKVLNPTPNETEEVVR